MSPGRLAGRNLGLLLVLAALWGTAFMFITLGLPSYSPLLFAALRFDIAGGVLLIVALARRSPLWPRGGAQWAAIGVAATLNVGAYHALLFWGQRFTTPAIAAVIVGLSPILTTVMSRALLTDERVGWRGTVGLVVGLLGVIALATLRPGCVSIFDDPAGALACVTDARGLGELAVLAAIASWALGGILVRRSKHGMDLFAFTAWQMLVGAVALHVGALVLDRPYFASWDASGVVSLLYLAIVSSSLGFLIYFTLLERLGPIRVNLVSQIAPVFAALAGWMVLGAPVEPRAFIGFLLIAAGFGLVARPVDVGKGK